MTYLLDVNVWIALAVVGHAQEAVALQWFSELQESDDLLFCRVTQQGFLRLLTNRTVMRDDVLTHQKAWKEYDLWKRATKAKFESEPPGLEEIWRQSAGQNSWTDAYLAAFATAGGFTLVTFDKAFLSHKGLSTKLLAG